MTPAHRMDAARAYLQAIQARGLSLEVQSGRLLIPEGETTAEIALVRLLKPELLAILEQECSD